MPKLFVIGDSFSVPPADGDTTKTWVEIAADRLSKLSNSPIEVINRSLLGSSQDWAWLHIQAWVDSGELTSEDFLIIALTHPGRYWYLDRLPDMSNSNIIDLDRWVSPEESKAIELFIKHIQRPNIDMINLVNRLSYLGYHTVKNNIRKPLVVKCFKQNLLHFDDSEDINISKGSLFEDIQYWEFENPEKEQGNGYFSGIDCRYNHLCLSNHLILGQRVADSLWTGNPLDLKTGYIRNLLKPGLLDDAEFCSKELSLTLLELRKNELKKAKFKHPIIPWNKRTGISNA